MRVQIVKGQHKGQTGEIVGTLWGAGLTLVKLDDINTEISLTPYDFIPIKDKGEKTMSIDNTKTDDTETKDYIMLGGKKIPITVSKEKLIELGLIPEEKVNPFERVNPGKNFWYIRETGLIAMTKDTDISYHRDLYKTANYCTDQELILQRSLHEQLSRLLWRFTIENGYENIDWGNDIIHHISMHINTKKFYIESTNSIYVNENVCYFYTKEIAQRAIDEIIKPFMKENPKFVW